MSLVLACVGEERTPVDIAYREEPGQVWHPQRVVDVDRRSRIESDRLKTQVLGARAPAGGDQDLIALDRFPLLQLDGDLGRVATHGLYSNSEPHVDAALAERFSEQLAHERLLPRQEAVRDLDQRHVRAELAVGLSHLDADDAAAEDDQARGDRGGGRRLAVGPGTGFREAGDGRDRRGAADRDHHRLACVVEDFAHPHTALPFEPAAATEQRDSSLLEPRDSVRVVEPVDHLVAACQRGPDVELAGARLGRAGNAPRFGERVGWPQQRLRGHARIERAFAADELGLDHRDSVAALAEATRDHFPGGTGADHDHVERVAHSEPPSLSSTTATAAT